MQPLVSVIVPVYKVEDCLARCLDSLCDQSLRDIELILVDDASPDRCGDICEEYAAKDVRFKVFHHSVNRGLSAARNTGISNATGVYLMFVDSDDFVHEDYCKKPYENAVLQQADLVLFRFRRVDKNVSFLNGKADEKSSIPLSLLENGYKTTTEALDLLREEIIGQAAWNKLYKKELFQEISYPTGYYFEDWGTTYKIVLRATRIFYLNSILYYYCIHEDSITSQNNEKALHDWTAMAMQQYRDLTDRGYSAEKLELFLVNIAFNYCIWKKRDLLNSEYVYYANILMSCKYVPEDFTWKRKILFVLFKYYPAMFELLCNVFKKKFTT